MLALLALFVFHVEVQAQLYYTTNNDEIIIRGYTGSPSEITIPNKIDGYPVTTIWNAAFNYCGSLTKVTIGNRVTSIGWSAFSHCTSLTRKSDRKSDRFIIWAAEGPLATLASAVNHGVGTNSWVLGNSDGGAHQRRRYGWGDRFIPTD